jgi:restriction system protein
MATGGGRMARRKQGTADDFVDLVALLPWWAGLGFAVVFYFLIHPFAIAPLTKPLLPLQVMFRTLATAGQYFVPFLCVLAAFVSLMRRRKRQHLFETVVQAPGAEALNSMSWQEFELFVGEAFRLQGYQVTEQGGAAADGGVDLLLRKGTETFLVQCKQWKAFKVGVDKVRELYGVMAAQGAAGGFMVTSGAFTPDAISFASGRNVQLIDGPKLFDLIQRVRASRGKGTAVAAPRSAAIADPSCPTCTSPMVRRMAGKGINAGKQFWGCSRYPACRGTR